MFDCIVISLLVLYRKKGRPISWQKEPWGAFVHPEDRRRSLCLWKSTLIERVTVLLDLFIELTTEIISGVDFAESLLVLFLQRYQAIR